MVGRKEARILDGVHKHLKGCERSSAVKRSRRFDKGEIIGVEWGTASVRIAMISKGSVMRVVSACQPN